MDNTKKINLHHAGQLLASLAKLRLDPDSCDVLLQVESTAEEVAGQAGGKAADDSRGVWAHRVVLAAASPYFFRIFARSFEKPTTQVLVVKKLKLETLQALVCNIYSPESLPESIDGMKELLVAAKLFQVEDVRNDACTALEQALTPKNALSINTFAEQYACSGLAAVASQYMYNHFDQVLKAEEVLDLKPNELVALLHSNRNAVMEECILDAVLQWTEHRPQERRHFLATMLQRLQLRQVPREVLTECARAEPLVSQQQALIKVTEAMTADRERPGISGLTTATQRGPRPDHDTPSSLLIIGGDTYSNCTNSVLFCSLPSGRWQSLASLWVQRAAAGAAVLDGRVYLIGGRDGSFPVRTVFMYNAPTDTWLPGPTLTRPRTGLGVAALDGRLYAVGGRSNDKPTFSWIRTSTTPNSAETLDPREGIWRPIAIMSTRISMHGVAALKRKLYAIGGNNGKGALHTAERLD